MLRRENNEQVNKWMALDIYRIWKLGLFSISE